MLKDYFIEDDAFYLYTCALLSQRESEFIDKQKIDRLINAANKDEFLRILQETYYGKYITIIDKEKSLNSMIMEESRKNIDFLKRFLKSKHQILKEFYLLKVDLQNVKIIMKAIDKNRDFEDIFNTSLYSYQQMKEAFENDKFNEIDRETMEIIVFAKKIMNEEKNQRIRELELEKFYINKIYKHIKDTKSEMLLDLIKHTIDMYNIKNIYRSKISEDNIPFNSFLYSNGFLDIKELKKFEKESTDIFIQFLEKTPYIKMIFQGTNLFSEKKTFIAFERNEDEFVLNFFDTVKYNVANIEKIIGFFLRKNIEYKNLNIIFTGVLYSIDKKIIKSRVAI